MMNRDTLQPDRNRKSKIKRHIHLEIIALYKQSWPVHAIVRKLADRGIDVSWGTVKNVIHLDIQYTCHYGYCEFVTCHQFVCENLKLLTFLIGSLNLHIMIHSTKN
jgi:hypothetical protein